MSNPTRTSVGKCLFCAIGDAKNREVVCIRTPRPPLVGFEDQSPRYENNYECGLGKIGEGCIIPRMYQISIEGSETARYASEQNPRIG